MPSHSSLGLREDEVLVPWPRTPGQEDDARASLVRRVLTSATFEHCPKLRAFLEYVCRCALDDVPAAATESQIGIHVFGRTPGYNTNEDNIVRAQARLLRMKLEHHFAHEGRHEPLIITIPKGRYLPVFDQRFGPTAVEEPELPVEQDDAVEEPLADAVSFGEADALDEQEAHPRRPAWVLFSVLALALVLIAVWAVRLVLSRRSVGEQSSEAAVAAGRLAHSPLPTAGTGSEVRIAAGATGQALTDADGRQWAADDFYQGGVSKPGPQEFFPPVANPALFSRIREGTTLTPHAPAGFRYDIPVPAGVYELRLYFADPIRHDVAGRDGQHLRHFQVNLNGDPILTNFDAVADGGFGAVDIRAFKDVSPGDDGKIHLEFLPSPDRPFLSALELTPGTPGKLQPIRFTANASEVVDANGVRWESDRYFINGTTLGYSSPEGTAKVPRLYSTERYGNFTYAIPVPQGSYTVRLHFMETFWGPSAPNGFCAGAGCRVFDVYCNGQTLLKDFDIVQAAGADFVPVVRSFSGLRPNGQGKLLLSFSPSVDYAEIRAIEVIDDAAGADRKKH